MPLIDLERESAMPRTVMLYLKWAAELVDKQSNINQSISFIVNKNKYSLEDNGV